MPSKMKTIGLPLIAGVGLGSAIGYVAGGMSGNYEAIRPRIDASRYILPTGTAYSLYFRNFPPNRQLVGPIALSGTPSDLANIGTTDASGNLTVNTTSANTAGTYYIIAWDALTGKYVAAVTIAVT